MTHRAAIYGVTVHPIGKPGSLQPFGNFAGDGMWAGDVAATSLKSLKGVSPDSRVTAVYESLMSTAETTQVGCTVRSGRSGVTSMIERNGDAPFSRTEDHFERVRTGLVFELPRGDTYGLLAVHSSHGHSCKAIVAQHVKRSFHALGSVLDIKPIVPIAEFKAAVDAGLVNDITLVKRQPRSSNTFADAARWGDSTIGKAVLKLEAEKDHRLDRGPLKRFLEDSSTENRRAIVEFGGMVFDEAFVTVSLSDGSERTFQIDGEDKGHPLAVVIDLAAGDQYGPLAADIRDQLVTALKRVTAPA
jgi:hypothetical protein